MQFQSPELDERAARIFVFELVAVYSVKGNPQYKGGFFFNFGQFFLKQDACEMTQQFDPGIFQAALLQIAEATQSAAAAAKAASAAATAAGTSQGSSGSGAQSGAKHVDWPKSRKVAEAT